MTAGWAPDYASTSELASLVRIEDTLDDAQLALALSTASRAVDHATGRQFGLVASAEVRYYTARWDRRAYRWMVEVDDLMTSTGLAMSVDLLGRGDYIFTVDTAYIGLRPSNASAKARPWTNLTILPTSPTQMTEMVDGIKVTGRWGWTSVPDTIKQATLLQASRFLARRDAPFGVAGSPAAGAEVRLLAKVDPDVAVSVAPYRRWWGAA
jgi:hypothetical protein